LACKSKDIVFSHQPNTSHRFIAFDWQQLLCDDSIGLMQLIVCTLVLQQVHSFFAAYIHQ